MVRVEDYVADKSLYEKSYFKNESSDIGYADYEEDEQVISATAHKRLSHIEKQVPRETLLDVGCATGIFIKAAKERGWNAQGIDISRYASAIARRDRNKVFTGKITNARIKKESISVITMWDYLEHIPNPAKDIIAAGKLLTPGGMLVITTPNINCFYSKVLGKKWFSFKPQEHLWYFNLETLTKLLNQNGFEVFYSEQTGRYVPIKLIINKIENICKPIGKVLSWISNSFGLENAVTYIKTGDVMVYAQRM